MREILEALLGDVNIAGYHIPVVVLLAVGFFLLGVYLRSLWPAMIGALIILIIYILIPAATL
ncbi:MAG: hypothetical protein Q8P46_08025 [Hyphomicrobiales bacterium]|jgi:hypothetical protein|nr:hypothetical protein [Hyphomicrobiales bacterium]